MYIDYKNEADIFKGPYSNFYFRNDIYICIYVYIRVLYYPRDR